MFKSNLNLIHGINELVKENSDMHMDIDYLLINKDEEYSFCYEVQEACYLLVKGEVEFISNETHHALRNDTFKDEACALHTSKNVPIKIRALQDSEILIQRKVNDATFPEKYYDSSNIDIGYFGEGPLSATTKRKVTTILDYERTPYSKLVIGEIINLPGIWSSYPPHSHPQPEVYFYKFDKEQGFGSCFIQDDVYKITNNSLALIEGEKTHPQNAAPGYAMYYVWMIPHLENNPWTKIRNFDPQHTWVNNSEVDIFKF